MRKLLTVWYWRRQWRRGKIQSRISEYLCTAPEIVGRNEAVRRMLAKG